MTSRMKLVPAEATEEMKTAARMKIPGGHGQAWIYAGEAVDAAVAAAPHSGKVSREAFEKVAEAIRNPWKVAGNKLLGELISEWHARAVITALGLEVEE